MSHYLGFLALVSVVTLAPGPDKFLTLRNTAVAGRAAGLATLLGICLAAATQGLLAATGLGALILHAEPVFQVLKWAGVCYLGYLGVTALRSAWRGAEEWDGSATRQSARSSAAKRFRQGFLCNITNPKVLVFNLAVLPQFVGPSTSIPVMLLYAMSLALFGGMVLIVITLLAHAVARHLRRTRVRQALDASVGTVMLAFAGTLAAEG